MQLANRTVEDAFIDWNVNCSNSTDFYVQLDEKIDTEPFLPLTGEPIGNRNIYVQWVNGAALGFQEGDSFENRRTYTVEHEDGREITGTWSYDHTLLRDFQRYGDSDITPVQCRIVNRGRTPIITLEKAKEIMARYINEDVNSTGTSYWDWKRNPHDWRRAVADREQIIPYIDGFAVFEEGDGFGPKACLLEEADEAV